MEEGAMGSTPETAALITSIMKEREELLKMLEPLPGRISELLEAGRITDAHERHYLAYVEREVSSIVASLRMPLPPPPPRDRRGVDLIRRQKDWLEVLKDKMRGAIGMVNFLCKRHREEAPRALLRKPMRCFRRPMSFNYAIDMMKLLCDRHPRSLKYDILYLAHRLYRVCSIDPRLELPSSKLMPSLHQAAQVEAAAVHDHLVGIDGTANELLGWLMAADKSLRVMAIAGPAGIGKTTLAMELHRRLRCQTHFQCHVVANLSRRPAHRSKQLLLQTILKQIMEQLEAPSSPNSSEITMLEDDPELLARNISECLKDKRYFALIDDIFDGSDLEMIKGAFPNNNCSSRILFTARDEQVSGWFLSNYNGVVHKMKPLNDSDSEKLLRTKAFSSMDGCLPDNLRLLCDEILNMCRGIPLFITSMADWLKQHQQQYGSSAVPRVEQVRLLLKQFEHWLSFDYSDGLRQSSLYLSMFPQGYVFENKDHLVTRLEDEGFIPEQNFSWLLNRKIIIPAAENCGLNIDEDDLCQWQVNPFILRFLASRAAEMGLVFTSSTLTLAPSGGGNTTRIARRLALHHLDPQLPAMLQQMDLSQTRSLLISGAVDRTTVALDKFGYLVLLDLEGWENLKDEDLLQICKMFMLSYLSVRNTKVSKLAPQIKELRILRTLDISRTNISEIPSELCDLNYLEMLDLRGTRIRHLPEKVKQLTSLERLDISHTKISDLPSRVCRLPNLQTLDLRGTLICQLPDQFVQIKRLRHLIVGSAGAGSGMIYSDQTVLTKIPETIHQLRYLKTLATIDLSEFSTKSIQSLGDLQELRVLAITWSFHQCSNKDYQQALRSSIEGWWELESMTIHCGLGCSMEFLGSLTEPPNGLKKIKVIDGKFASVPRWIRGLKHLTFLQITVCKQVADDLKILAGLIELQHLVLGLEFIPEKAIVIEKEGFKELERFSLDCPVPWLTFEKEAMRKLTYLRLTLHAFPASDMSVPSGINNLKELTEVTLCYNVRYINSPNIKMTTDAVSKEVAKHSNTIDLFINGIRKDVIRSSDKKEESATGSEVDAAEDGAQAADEATLRTTIQVQSEIEVEGETESHT